MFVYMKVSRDKYELPLAIADSVAELSKIVKTSKMDIRTEIGKRERGQKKWTPFIRVEIDDDE